MHKKKNIEKTKKIKKKKTKIIKTPETVVKKTEKGRFASDYKYDTSLT